MGARFVAVPANTSLIEELGALVPANPFATVSFFESRRQLGYATWVLALRDDARGLECGCGAFLSTGRLNRRLEIPSLPAMRADGAFWEGLREFCRDRGVTMLELGTFGSPPGVEIPNLGTHCMRRSRCEFVLDLGGDPRATISSSHRRNVKRAQRAGLEVRRTRAAEAVTAHHALISQSMERRRNRGENVGPATPSPDYLPFLRSGAGELFQAVRNTAVLSSVLVLRAPQGAFYQSAGTSPEGMSLGASHYLIHTIASLMRAEGALVFNLGGADEASGLAYFKEGFGASRVPLPSASCYIGPSWRRRVGQGIALIRSDRETLRQWFTSRTSRLIVYAADTRTARPTETQTGLVFRALTPEDLHALSVEDRSFRAGQLERLTRFGASYAYGVFADGQIAHVSWLLPSTAIKRDVPRVLRARVGEAEITGCETLPAFRGRGIYGVAIRNLVEVAREQGVRRVFMKTGVDNRASQSGIEKAGLQRVGSATVIELPMIQRPVVWRRFR